MTPTARFALVNEGVGELRRLPSHAAEQVSQVILGTPLRILGTRDGGRWLRVQGPDAYRGWIRSWSVTPASRRDVEAYGSGATVEVEALVARVREGPSGRSAPLREATLGARLTRLGHRGRWIRVGLPDGTRGYLNARDLLLDPGTLRTRRRPRDIPSLLRTAHRFLGVPYQWGGVTAKGVDCSGFVQSVFRLHGVLLPRDARDQFRWVRKTTYLLGKPRDLQYGHLVFFGESDARISHVGIGLSGGRFIHSRGRVRVGSLFRQDVGFEEDLLALFRGAGPVPFREPR
jgi:cell wall-associated NlpC family hydrolase